MRISMLLTTLILSAMSMASAQNPSSQDTTQQQPTASSGAGTLTGCLMGSQDQYYIVEKNGTRHTLMAKNQDLSSYVNHKVTVTGKADTTRNPGAGSDAEANRKGFFSVDSVSDQGACKKK